MSGRGTGSVIERGGGGGYRSRNGRGGGGGFRGRGGTGGRGGGGGFRGRGGGYRGGRGNWQQPQPSSSTSGSCSGPVAQTASKTEEEIINYWSNNDAQRLPPPPPIKFEPPETDFHLVVTEEQRLFRESRDLLIGFNGQVIGDCRGVHNSADEVCMLCDGRRGPWVMKNPPNDPAFRRYQDDVIASRARYAGGGNANQPQAGPNLFHLLPESEIEAGAIFDDKDFGL